MIKTLSPHYLEIPFVNPTSLVVCEKFVLKIYIWDGAKDAVPATSSYQMTKINAVASDGVDRINISRIINDFIDFNITVSSTTSLEDGNNQVWVKTEVYYSDMPTIAQEQSIQLAVKGYGYFQEGENPSTPVNKILLTGDEFKVNRDGFFVLPFLLDETPPVVPFLSLDDITDDQLSFSTNISYSEIYYRYKLEEDTEWTIGAEAGTASPFTIELPTVAGTYYFQIFTYDVLTDEMIYSDSYTLIIV